MVSNGSILYVTGPECIENHSELHVSDPTTLSSISGFAPAAISAVENGIIATSRAGDVYYVTYKDGAFESTRLKVRRSS